MLSTAATTTTTTTTTTMPTIKPGWSLATAAPQEVVDQVIDHLHDDPDCLRQCTLVCHSWVPSSTYHLIQRARWPKCDHAWDENTPKTCTCPRQAGPYPIKHDTLSDLFEFLTPRVGRCLRELRLSGYQSFPRDCNPRPPSIGRFISITTGDVFAILDRLPRLRTLELSQLHLEAGKGDSPLWMQRAGERDIYELRISYYPTTSLESLLLVVRHFRRISRLVLYDWSTVERMPVTNPSHFRPLVSSIEVLDNMAVSSVLDLVRKTLDISELSSLYIHNQHRSLWDYTASLAAFIGDAPSVCVYSCDASTSSLSDVVPSCSKLEMLSMVCSPRPTLLAAGQPAHPDWFSILAALEASPGTLHQVRIHLRIGGVPTVGPGDEQTDAAVFLEQILEQVAWGRVSQALARFTSLKTFSLRVYVPVRDAKLDKCVEVTEGILREHLPERLFKCAEVRAFPIQSLYLANPYRS